MLNIHKFLHKFLWAKKWKFKTIIIFYIFLHNSHNTGTCKIETFTTLVTSHFWLCWAKSANAYCTKKCYCNGCTTCMLHAQQQIGWSVSECNNRAGTFYWQLPLQLHQQNRAFKKMRLIKIFLYSTMTEDRLEGLNLNMKLHHPPTVIDSFSAIKLHKQLTCMRCNFFRMYNTHMFFDNYIMCTRTVFETPHKLQMWQNAIERSLSSFSPALPFRGWRGCKDPFHLGPPNI